jgi:hypothetical protein
MQIIANRAPIGFEAEFVNQRSENICYRGILMPFSSDGDAIDFIYGVINWKTSSADAKYEGAGQPVEPSAETPADVPELLLDQQLPPSSAERAEDFEEAEEFEDAEEFEEFDVVEAADAVGAADAFKLEAGMSLVDETADSTEEFIDESLATREFQNTPEEHLTWDDGPSAEREIDAEELASHAPPPVHFAWEDGSFADADPDEIAELVLDENAGLADRLWAARETADSVKAGEGRTRSALYRALSLAYDVAIVAELNPDDYAELLEESGVKAQARAPMTAIVKLVFGVDYDKARLTEFAAALSFGRRLDVELGAFKDLIEKQSGGLKALVAAERQARRPETREDTRGDEARARLRSAPAMSLTQLVSQNEFAVVITRRLADGSHEPVAVVEDEALIERAIRNAA